VLLEASSYAGRATGRVTQEVAEGMHGVIVKVVKNGEPDKQGV